MSLDAYPDLISKISQLYIRLYKKSDGQTQKDVQDIMTLIIANYYHAVNQKVDQNEKSINAMIDMIIGQQELSQFFMIIQPYLLNQDEFVQKITISSLIKLMNHYSKTVAKTLRYQQLPMLIYQDATNTTQTKNLLINDFSAHLVQYLFRLIDSYKDQADVAYSFAYKIIKLYEFNCLKAYSQQKIEQDLLSHIIKPIISFIKTTLTQVTGQIELYDKNYKSQAQFLYTNLTFLNLLLQDSIPSYKGLKMKNQRLSLSEIIKANLISQLEDDKINSINMAQWMIGILGTFQKGFKEGKCSYKVMIEEGIPGEVQENFINENSGSGAKLLRPIQETQSWKWHPIFIHTDGIFEVLDRKIPAQLILFYLFVTSSLTIPNEIEDEITSTLKNLCFRKPANLFLMELGEQALKQQQLKKQQMNQDQMTDDSKTLIESQNQLMMQKINIEAVFWEFIDVYEPIFHKFIKRKASITFNMQFQIHNLLKNLWDKAKLCPKNWNILISQHQRSNNTLGLFCMLLESSYILNEDSSKLCLALCALAFEDQEDVANSISNNFSTSQNASSMDLFKRFQVNPNMKNFQVKNINTDAIDLQKLVNTMLLGRNNKTLRSLAAQIVKGVYETGNRQIIQVLFDKISSLKSYGVNSYEYLSILQYVINREIQQNNLSEAQIQFVVSQIYKEVQNNNQQITAHPNLAIYSTLQKLFSAFLSSDQTESQNLMKEPQLVSSSKNAAANLLSMNGQPNIQGQSKKITNPYMLESEACSKCFEQRSLPYQNMRLNDMKTEAKFTDSTLIYKLNTTYNIKQIQMSLHDIKGVKVIKTLNFYINNKQGVDLADMKNNWNYWKRVKSVEIEVAQKNVIIDFTLPINASNILIEFQTSTLAKPLTGKDKAPPSSKGSQQIQAITVTGIDTVLATLPKEIINKIGYSQNKAGQNQLDLVQSSAFEKENMSCPRCGKAVQGRHGICNSCGENALQCTFCRNINYEKPDAYLCNECGFSRFSKFDFSMTVKQGYACEKIENDEQKNVANQQIEQHLQNAQTSYQILMKDRVKISNIIRVVNEGGDQLSYGDFYEIYKEECAETYQKMMRSLNNIKILRSEIDKFANGTSQSDDDNQEQIQLKTGTNSDNIQQSQCFSCIQEQLRSLLNFLRSTADNFSRQYKAQGFVDLLYSNNLNVHKQTLQEPAGVALCSLIINDEEESVKILERVQKDLKLKKENIPAYLLSQNLKCYSDLVLGMLNDQYLLKKDDKPNFFKRVQSQFWQILFNALIEGQTNSSIADQIAARLLFKIKTSSTGNQESEKLSSKLKNLKKLFEDKIEDSNILRQAETLQMKNFLITSLIMPTSLAVREVAKDIITDLAQKLKELQPKILQHALKVIDQVLADSSQASDQYFDILSLLLKEPITKEKAESNPIYIEAFEILFKQVDSELNNLVVQENQRQSLGEDGFMPQISTGQLLSRLVTLVSQMVKDSSFLKTKIQNNVSIVIKSFLKIRKLNLTKNKLVQDSEVELERMFKELHSEKEQDKEKFILECIKIIETGECDLQETRFLLEEVCKVINPIKPEPEYLLNLNKAPSQEFYFRGKMSKNPYTSTSLGKTMADVRIKICKEMELAEPELVELLVAGKIVNVDLSITQVYEQVYWPALCKQRDPENYEVPSIEEAPKSTLNPMSVIFRLMGIDGEATEDRVETLADSGEADSNPANIEKKFAMTQALNEYFDSQLQKGTKINGIQVLLNVLQSFSQLQKQRYLAEWLFKLITYATKLKTNRREFVKNKQTVGCLAKRLFESVGMQSQIDGQKGQSLFDNILSILEQIVSELNLSEDYSLMSNQEKMEVDTQTENSEAAIHVEIFIQIMSDACNEMTQNLIPLDKTSKKIRAVSKILPFLIKHEDISAIQIIADFLLSSISKVTELDQPTNNTSWTNKDRFSAQFNIERVIEILENTSNQKNFLKDVILNTDQGQVIRQILQFLTTTSMKEPSNELQINKYKISNQNILKILHGLVKNHPESQKLLQEYKVIDLLYQLTQAKHKEKVFILLSQDIVESLTNKNLINDESVKEYLQNIIKNQNDEKKKLAQKKKEEIMKQMQQKKNASKFLKQIESVSFQEEQGPKCIVCQDGYSKKPTDVLGMYVFSKKIKLSEISSSNGFVNTYGYTTVTHSNFIHYLCHQNAYRADASLKQPKKEWEGAAIRNDHTKCNNMFPMKGGNLPEDSYYQMVEKYFSSLTKTVAQCDSDRVKVVLHDFKMLLKRLSYEDSFSRDSQGGGPEHNTHLIPFMIQMISYLLKYNDHYKLSGDQKNQFTYVQEKKIMEFLEQGMKQKQDFMQKLEEEKKIEEIEEEEKFSEDMSSQQDEGDIEGDTQLNQMNNFKLDQLAFQLTQALVFCQMPRWEQYKTKFLSIILCSIAGMRDDKGQSQVLKPTGQQTEYATGKKVLTISKLTDVDVQMTDAELITFRRRRLSSDNKIDLVQRSLFRLRPLLIHMRLVDLIKQRWDGKRLSLIAPEQQMQHDEYLKKLNVELLGKGNLQEVIGECDEVFREYKDRMLKLGSVEEFIQEMGMMENVIKDYGSVEQYVLSHF